MAVTLTLRTIAGQTLATHRIGETPLSIRAQEQVQYHLADADGLAPANVQAARAGNDLLVSIDGQSALRIEDYFLLDDSGLKNPLLGLNGNGQYVAYAVVETPTTLPVEHLLAEEVAAVSAGSEGASVSALTAFGLGSLALGGLALASNSGDSRADNGNAKQPQTPPATNPPATNPPATNPPATNPPATNPPATNPPATNPPAPNPPPKPNGGITISGSPKVGSTLVANISDPDGVSGSPRYQWLADGKAIQGATQSTYTVSQADIGKAITVQASYTDNAQVAEKPLSPATGQVIDETPPPPQNHAPTDITLSADRLPENQAGVIIGKLATVDADKNDQHTYRISDDRFEVDAQGNLKLKDSIKVEFANEKTIDLTITTSDGKGGSYSETFTINVQDDPAYPAPTPPANDGKLGVYVPKPKTDFIANVKDAAYGAKGDGKTDDTAAIQKAINAVAEKGGGIVEIPAGTYLVDGTKNVVMKSNVIVRMADDTVLKTIPNDQPTYAIFRVQNVENVHFLGGTLVGDRYEHGTTEGQSGWGVQIYSSRNVVVENVVARDFRGDGFMVGRYYLREPQPENIVFYNVTADGNRRQGLFISDGDHIKVLNSTFKNTQGHPMEAGIDIEPNAPPDSPTGVPGIVRDVEVSGNTFENNAYYGIVVSRSRERPTTLEDVRITNNTFSGDGHAIHVIGLKGGEISGNTIADSNIDIPYFDINLEYSQNVAVRDNTMYGGRDRDLVKEGVTSSNTLSGSVRHAAVHIEGSAKVGETLTATVLDGDGQPTPPHITYTWRAGSDIVASGKNLPTYTVRPEDAGKAIRVAISFPHIYGDVAGQQENATSAPTLPVGSAGQHAPTDLFLRGGYTLPEKTDGAVVGKVTVRDKDVADHYALTVSDERFEIDSSGMLKLKAGQQIDYAREKYVSLALTARDDSGALSEAFTLRVQPPTPSQDANKPAAVIVQGFAKPGETLTAVVKDADDAPAGGIRYQWYADSQAIDGATASTYQVRAADAGKQIQVKADYTDNAGHRESMMSGATMTVPGAYSPPAPKPPANDGKLGVHVPKPVTDFVANAKDFGAKGDGQADDTLAIQKAIDAVAGKGGGVVEISGGTYMINTIAQAGKHSIVAADRTGILMKSNVILKLADDAVLQALPNASKGYSIVTFYDVDNAHLIGGTLIGERQQHQSLEGQSGHGVRILSAQNVAIENVTARDFWGDGFIVGINSSIDQRSQNIVFYNVTADNNRRQGMSIVDGQHIKVLDSVFKNTNGHMPLSGIDIEPNPGGVTTDIDIRGNRFENNSGFGVVVSGSQFNRPNSPYRGTTTKNINIENNVFEGNRDGIAIEGLIGGRVANNTIRHGNVVTSPSGGIRKLWLDDMSRDIVVENNTIYGGGYPRGYIEHGKLIEGGGIENLGQNNIVRNNDYKADVFIRGLVKSGETLTAHVYDGDIVPANVRYQWRADGKPIANANARSYRLTDADNGKRISVHVEFTDGADEKESATSAETNPVGSAQPNHAPHWAYVVGQYIADETPGHVIGKFGVHDPDPGETFSYRINDERFEIVADVLKLKNGISINDANEKSVSLAIEITDSGGDRFVRELDLTVAEYGTDGKDTFVVDGNGVKTIVGFNVSNGDVLQLESDAFTALEKGALAPGAFVKGKAATASSADHRILYDTESGTLAYDPDGNGSAAAVTIARLDPAAELEAAHILII